MAEPASYTVPHRGLESRFFTDNEDDLISRYHVQGQFYEIEELEYLRMLIPPRSHILDIGANIGNHSVYFSTHCRAERVIPFEASPRAIALLRMNCKANRAKTFDLDQLGLAVSDGPGTVTFEHVQKDNLGSQSFTDIAPVQAADSAQTNTIRTIAIDSLNLDKLDFVKIDVEGMEMRVLDGMSDTVRRLRPGLFCEIQEPNRAAFFGWCRDYNYRIERTYQMYRGVFNFSVLPNW